MPLWFQNLLVMLSVGGAGLYMGWQGIQALRGRRSKLGSCCAKGCAATKAPEGSVSTRTVFLPVEMLGRKR